MASKEQKAPVDLNNECEKEDTAMVTKDVFQDTLNQLARFERLYEKLQKCNEELRLENESIKRQLHELRASKRNGVDVGVQTDNIHDEYWSQYDYSWYQQSQNANSHHESPSEKTAQDNSGPKMGDIGEDGMPVWSTASEPEGTQAESIADGLKAAVTEVMQQNGVVYDENSGMYYDYDSGYYFDPERSRYYEPHSGTYYVYDSEKQCYKFHSTVDPTQYQSTEQNNESQDPSTQVVESRKRKGSKHRKTKKRRISNDNDGAEIIQDNGKEPDKKSDPKQRNEKPKEKETWDTAPERCSENDDGENSQPDEERLEKKGVMVEVSSSSEEEKEEGEVSDTESDDDTVEDNKNLSNKVHQVETVEEGSHFAPCIRAMVTSTDTIEVGTLFIITCQGGTIGREHGLNHTIIIPDLNVSKMHTSIVYIEDRKKYFVRDHASQNGTFLNGHRLSKAKVMSANFPLGHLNELKLGGTVLEIHIHPGTETCDSCEPGQVQATLLSKNKIEVPMLTKEEKDKLRRSELKQIKKKFGLENVSYIDDSKEIEKSGFVDKSAERRRTKGSDNPYQPNDAPASVERSIPETNKGHAMLAKMGWKEGKGLGADEQGRSEPVRIHLRGKAKAGLGADVLQLSLDDSHMMPPSSKSKNWTMARERFEKLVETTTPAFTPSSPARISEQEQQKRKPIWVPGGTIKPP